MLEIENLHAKAGDFLLSDIHLSVAASECHAVLGPSGSGKSTLLNAVLGVLPAAKGRIKLAGEDITTWPVERRRLGYVPQHLGLFPHLTVRNNLAYSARARKIPRSEFEPLLDRLIDITGIASLLNRSPVTLSGGERQRVALVRALAAAPRLVLLDEPFTALNESLRRELWWLVKELQADQGLSVLLITHDLTEAYFLAKNITVLIKGRQQQSGDKQLIYRRPVTLEVARFLGLKNLFPARAITEGVVDCPALGGRIEVSGGAFKGIECLVGIRSEDVSLCTQDALSQAKEVRLSGRFEAVLDSGETALMQFRANTGATLEIRGGSRMLRKCARQTGDDGIVGLSARDLFLIQL